MGYFTTIIDVDGSEYITKWGGDVCSTFRIGERCDLPDGRYGAAIDRGPGSLTADIIVEGGVIARVEQDPPPVEGAAADDE